MNFEEILWNIPLLLYFYKIIFLIYLLYVSVLFAIKSTKSFVKDSIGFWITGVIDVDII